MSKLFISHSSKDGNLVRSFIELLQLGMGINGKDIFCTSLEGELPSGQPFIPKIRKELEGCERVIFIITPNYLESRFCMMEMGAAWGLKQEICPILADGIRCDDLNNTPFNGIQMLDLCKGEDLYTLYDEFSIAGIIGKPNTALFSKKMEKFLEDINRENGNGFLRADAEGYYETVIEAVRKVPSWSRCYRIRGKVDIGKGLQADETQWIFYKAGVYEDLKEGDRVRFKISTHELKNFPDLKHARNLYPDDLIRAD